MKVIVNVSESEFVTRTYEIQCGAGNQFISWLATAACLRFGQDHYPNGIYVPNMLKKDDPQRVPHPRVRINNEFEDGDSCTVTLKDRFRPQSEEEKQWYDRAFGPERNIMKVELSFTPPSDVVVPKKFQFFAKFNYQMFPEMVEEFGEDSYPHSELHLLQVQLSEENTNGERSQITHAEYSLELERPYGKYDIQLFYRQIDQEAQDAGGEPAEPLPVEERFLAYFRDYCEPQPISREDQKLLDDQEEKDNKEKEREARQAQKELEQRKARQKAEAQQQLLKQEQNSAKLKVYFSAMDLYFHKQEEDFNASMSLLSIFHLELHDNFKYYASVIGPFYKRKENEMIPLQGFFHFAKLMNLAQSAEELMSFFQQSLHEIDGMYVPVDDTLNIRGGMNYAQFLSALLRIGYIKAEQSGEQSNQAYKNALDNMFQTSNIDIQKRQMNDPILAFVYEQDNNRVFYEYEHLLCAIFTAKSVKLGDTFLQMNKIEFVNLLAEIDLLIMPKKKTPEEEKKEKEAKDKQAAGQPLTADQTALLAQTENVFAEAEVSAAIGGVSTFDPDYLDYYNFLECIIRVAKARPWTEEEDQQSPHFEAKLDRICSQLEGRFHEECLPIFEGQRDMFETERRYQPRIVVDDEEDGASDDDELQ